MADCLIVDDSRTIRKVVRRMLEELGFAVEEAENGLAALSICRERSFDLLLLDWNMPVMDGGQFLAAWQDEQLSWRPCILLCTTESDASIGSASDLGADGHLTKPFDRTMLECRLRDAGVIAAHTGG